MTDKLLPKSKVTRALIAGLCVAALTGAAARAEVGFKQDRLHQTIELSGLYSAASCTPRIIKGKIVKREFTDDGAILNGFVFERPDGTRQYVNTALDPQPNATMQSIVNDGLQRLTRVGRIVHGRALQCGVSSHDFMIQQIE